ncbi:signal transduction histidine kinase [Armatimonas rosea]|uniref:histidine kinase n=2 Tax=Armatimonas rosea TaxID=685828 RepID=A0A7W9SRW6_ARMRO|nr:signal transduction histidine kinase [Armatimonas rosea]
MSMILVLFFSLVLYLAITLSSANSNQTRLAAWRAQNTARLCARLLERRCQNAFTILHTLVERPTLTQAVQKNDRSMVVSTLKDSVDLLPDLLAAATYNQEGEQIAEYPAVAEFPQSIAAEPWFAQLYSHHKQDPPLVNNVVHLRGLEEKEALAMAIPVRNQQGIAVGVLVAYFRLGNFYDWLTSIRFYSGTVILIDNTQRIVATSSDATAPQESAIRFLERRVRPDYAPYQKALQGSPGAELYRIPPPLEASFAPSQQEQMVGYTPTLVPGWVILVAQPTDAAFAPYRYLLRNFAIVGIPLLLAVPVISWNLFLLYERLQRLALALGQRNESLHRLNLAKSDLLANISHDLKTPISTMQLSVSNLLEADSPEALPPSLSPEVTECLTLVSQELDTLASRVRNLLEMSRLESEVAPVLQEPCDLTDIIANALERVRVLSKDHSIQTHFPATPLLVMGDPTQLEIVALNLLENALKYSFKGSPLLLVGELRETEVVFQVTNRGESLPPGTEEKIFEKFYRRSTTSMSAGTGLGLAICRTLVEGHGGQISAQNEPFGGVTVTVTLPHCTLLSASEPAPERESV